MAAAGPAGAFQAPGWLKWAVALAVSAPAFVGAAVTLERVPPPVVDVNMLFVPPKALMTSAATGFENVVADALWLNLLQYYGDRVTRDNHHCVNLPAAFDLITDLDPRFYFAYWLGTWAIADNGEVPAALALLAKAERLNPQDWNYPYLQGFVHFLYRRDYATAAACFERAAAVPGANRFAASMAARMRETSGQESLALSTWRNIAEKAPDASTRAIAARNVKRILEDQAAHRESIYVKQDRLQRKGPSPAFLKRLRAAGIALPARDKAAPRRPAP